MTRGTLFYYESDDEIYSSVEFNGDMYHGTQKDPEGVGSEAIELMSNLESLDDFKGVLEQINRHYGYEEGNNVYSVSELSIKHHIREMIDAIENNSPDLKNTKDDPRTWEKIPCFKDTNTWKFWGIPNLSDFSYIYNNSGKDLIMETRGNKTMIIPDGCVGVLNYGENDCLCKDGKVIDGMGHYKEDEIVEDTSIETKIKFIDYGEWEIGKYYIHGNSRYGYEVYGDNSNELVFSSSDIEECWKWIYETLKGGNRHA